MLECRDEMYLCFDYLNIPIHHEKFYSMSKPDLSCLRDSMLDCMPHFMQSNDSTVFDVLYSLFDITDTKDSMMRQMYTQDEKIIFLFLYQWACTTKRPSHLQFFNLHFGLSIFDPQESKVRGQFFSQTLKNFVLHIRLQAGHARCKKFCLWEARKKACV